MSECSEHCVYYPAVNSLESALALATKHEAKTDQRWVCVAGGAGWSVENRMPPCGVEWYDADGIRHG